MAATQEPTVSLRILVDKEKHRIVLAEANKDFVDILFSFLTLPMGTIIRLVGKQQSSEPAKIGCMNNLYRSVENLSTDYLRTDKCKLMLLHPRNIWTTHFRNLKVNVDDSEPKYFICSDIECTLEVRSGLLSNYMNARCRCGKLMDREIGFKDSDVNANHGSGEVFITGVTNFIISDDLQVMTSSPGTSIKLLSSLGIRDVNQLDDRTLHLGLEEHSLISKSPLTDAFLPKQGFISSTIMLDPKYSSLSQNKTETATTSEKMTVKAIIRKSDNKTLYAEARKDFVDFLFSFLTIPLGSVVTLLGGESTLGCIDSLYKSVEGLNSEWFVQLKPKTFRGVLESAKNKLLNSRLAPQYSCRNQPLNIYVEESPKYSCYSNNVLGKPSYYLRTLSNFDLVSSSLTLLDPKTPAGEKSCNGGFVRSPTIIMVSDDFVVTPLSFHSISFLKTLEIPIDDLEERVISIGEGEALSLLKATLISTSALTKGLNLLLKKPKQEE